MKIILISSVISLTIGFSLGWLIKSASTDLESFVPEPGMNNSPSHSGLRPESPPARVRPDRPSSENGPARGTPHRIATVPEAAKRPDRAKWMRLIEVLGLNDIQAKALEAVMAEPLPVPDSGKSPEIAYTEAGALLESNILALLDADQRTAFTDLQRRTMANRIEMSAQKTYAQELGEFDLSPEQRRQALDLLRGRAERIAAEIPASTHLLLAGSFLPVGDVKFSEDAIRLQRQISPQDTGDITLDKLAGKRRAESEEIAALLEAVLTPAQLELYRSRLPETPNILDEIRSGD